MKKPERISEATVQAELYHQSKLAGLNCVLEMNIKLESGKILRADLAYYDEFDEVYLLVEVKKNRKKKINTNSRQYNKYQQSGIQWIYCKNIEQIPLVIEKAKLAELPNNR